MSYKMYYLFTNVVCLFIQYICVI